jgi:hypothetical protein
MRLTLVQSFSSNEVVFRLIITLCCYFSVKLLEAKIKNVWSYTSDFSRLSAYRKTPRLLFRLNDLLCSTLVIY